MCIRDRNQILGRAMLESIMFMDGKCIASYFRQKTLEFYGAVSYTHLDVYKRQFQKYLPVTGDVPPVTGLREMPWN